MLHFKLPGFENCILHIKHDVDAMVTKHQLTHNSLYMLYTLEKREKRVRRERSAKTENERENREEGEERG